MPLPSLPVGLENHADQILSAYRAAVSSIQSAVLSAEGRYLQALRQPMAVPVDGAEGMIDPVKTRPSDRATSLADRGITLPASAKVATSVHEYLSPLGPGWGILQEVRIAGRDWQRYVHIKGPETGTGYDWTDVTPEKIEP